MPETPAIELRDVTKTYRLFGSQREQLMEVLGLNRLGFGRGRPHKEFVALSGISLSVPRGARVGVVGRNGAGKSTLLKLISGNFAPTEGTVTVTGEVQALMGMGMGFHPEYTGRENAVASLQYNGLLREDYEAALQDIIEFCELGEFIDQPFKTYSLGMQARLMFATSTAIRPDILIVDEVLGAGDAYFIAKSRLRMERLVDGGCTMLLVSHSTQQVLEMCQDAIWLDGGRIRMQGDAFSVIKEYEEYVHGAAKAYLVSESRQPAKPVEAEREAREQRASDYVLQEPAFLPHAAPVTYPPLDPAAEAFPYPARGGLSRWESEAGVKISGFTFQRDSGETNQLVSMQPARMHMTLRAELDGEFSLRYGIAVHDMHGRCITRVFSPEDRFRIATGETREVTISFNPLQLGPGQFTLGISVLEYGPLELINTAKRYDLLGRSFDFSVELPNSLGATECAVYHTAEWRFS